MPASGDEYDFDTLRMGPAQGGHVSIGNLELGIQQGAIYVDGQKTDGDSHYWNFSTEPRPGLDTYWLESPAQ